MPTQPSFAAFPSAADQRAEDALYYRQVLHDMIEIGIELVRQLPEQAKPQAATGPAEPAGLTGTDVSAAYERLTRAVRRSIMLAQKLAETSPATAGQQRFAARKRILRAVEDVIQREKGCAEADGLHVELRERLDSPDLDDDLDERPVDEIISEICHDLGLAASPGTRPWKRRTPREVENLCGRAGLATNAAAMVVGHSPPIQFYTDAAPGPAIGAPSPLALVRDG
jgi:hypothetical protein